MKNTMTDNIKLLFSIGGIILAVGLLIGELRTTTESVRALGIKVDNQGEAIGDMEVAFAELNTTIEGAKGRGEISQAPQEDLISLATPTISGTSATPTPEPVTEQEITYNTTLIQPTPEIREPTPVPRAPEPTPPPTPTLAMNPTSPLLCVLRICL